jgi:flagellar capping protein FliD
VSKLDTGGEYSSLRDIGIVINDSLQLTIDDEDLLTKALSTNLEDVTELFSGMMGDIDSILDRFTGSKGYMYNAQNSLNSQLRDVDTDIKTMEGRLDSKQSLLITQYSQLQAQLYTMQYTQSIMSSLNQYG